MLHVISTWCVAHDLHTIVAWQLEHTCWRRFAAQRGDCKFSNCTFQCNYYYPYQYYTACCWDAKPPKTQTWQHMTIFLLPPFLLHSHGPHPTPLPSSPQFHLIWDDEHPSFHTWTQKAGLCFSVMDALLSQQTARLFWVVQAGLPHQFLLPVNTHIDNYLYLLTDNYLYLLTDNYLYLLTASHTNFSYLYLLTDNYLYLLTACHTNFSWQLPVSANSLPHQLLTTTCIC